MIASVALVTLALASSAVCQFGRPTYVPTLSRTEVRDDYGQFSLAYTTGDGTARSAHGALKQLPDGTVGYTQQGTVAYTSPEGIPVSWSYVADENGYRADGSHIPKAPVPVQPTL